MGLLGFSELKDSSQFKEKVVLYLALGILGSFQYIFWVIDLVFVLGEDFSCGYLHRCGYMSYIVVYLCKLYIHGK